MNNKAQNFVESLTEEQTEKLFNLMMPKADQQKAMDLTKSTAEKIFELLQSQDELWEDVLPDSRIRFAAVISAVPYALGIITKRMDGEEDV